MRRILVCFFAFLIFISPLFVSASASRVIDEGGMLSATEKSELENKLSAATAECGFEIKLVFHDLTTEGYLYEWEMLDMLSADSDDDLAVFLITKEFDGYYYELFLYGEPDGLLSWDASDSILDSPDAYSNIKGGRLAAGAKALIAATSSTTADLRSGRVVGVIVSTVVITLLAGGGTALGIFFSYKKKQKSPSYPLSKYASLNLTDASDAFLGSSVVKTRINTSSSRGGSRGGGGSRGRR